MKLLNIAVLCALLFMLGLTVNAWQNASREETMLDRAVGSMLLATQAGDKAIADPYQDAPANWFARQGIDLAFVRSLPDVQRAQLLNFLTYRYCQTGNETPVDLNGLFDSCVTQCGGYAYVFRGLASAANLETRYANLYNIPNQGNHVGVEVQLEDDGWAFFDPTFGAFFTSDGQLDGDPLGLADVIRSDSETTLARQVLQANRELPLSTSRMPEAIYTESFEHLYMSLNNYRNPEAITTGNRDELLMLRIPLVAGGGAFGLIGSDNRAEARAFWLSETNRTLNDDMPLNDTSFATHLMLNRDTLRATMLVISDTKRAERYRIRLRLFNPGLTDQRLQLTSVGKETVLESPPVHLVPPGSSLLDTTFRAETDQSILIVRAADKLSYVEMFGVDVAPLAE